jgi:hypothetical protein
LKTHMMSRVRAIVAMNVERARILLLWRAHD